MPKNEQDMIRDAEDLNLGNLHLDSTGMEDETDAITSFTDDILVDMDEHRKIIRKRMEEMTEQQNNPARRKQDPIEEHSTFFKAMMGSALSANQKLKYPPNREEFTKSLNSEFKLTMTEEERRNSIADPKSELYRKAQNAAALNANVKDYNDMQFNAMLDAMNHYGKTVPASEVNDLAQFMDPKDNRINHSMIDLFYGKDGQRSNEDVRFVMDIIAKQVLNTSISDLRLDSDEEIAKNAGKLEKITRQLGAFERLMEKTDFLSQLDETQAQQIESKLIPLRAVSAYYSQRKELINDEYYMTHTGEELSVNEDTVMSDDPALAEKQEKVAEKLMNSYVLLHTLESRVPFEEQPEKEKMQPEKAKEEKPLTEKELKQKKIREEQINDMLERFRIEEPGQEDPLADVVKGVHAENDEAAMDFMFKANAKPAIRAHREELRQVALQNAIHYSGYKELQKDYKPQEYSAELLEKELKELEGMNPEDVKMGSVDDFVNHFEKNREICLRAEQISDTLTRGLLRGAQIDDERMKEIRAKLMFYHEALCMTDSVTSKLITSQNAMEQTDQELISSIGNGFIGAKNSPRMPLELGDPNKMLDKYRKKISDDFNQREQSIKDMWNYKHSTLEKVIIIDDNGKRKRVQQIVPAPEMPKELLEEKKKEFQKNAAIMEQMSRFVEACANGAGYENTTYQAYCELNGLEYTPFTRTEQAILKGQSAEEIIRLHKMRDGTPKERFQFYTIMDDFSKELPLSAYNTQNLADWYENFHAKHNRGVVMANQTDISEAIKKMLEDPDLSKDLQLPPHYQSIEQMIEENKVMYDVGCALVSGRYNALGQLPYCKYNGVMSLDEWGNFSGADHEHLSELHNYYDKVTDFSKYSKKTIEKEKDPVKKQYMIKHNQAVSQGDSDEFRFMTTYVEKNQFVTQAIDNNNPAGKRAEFKYNIEDLAKEIGENYKNTLEQEKALNQAKRKAYLDNKNQYMATIHAYDPYITERMKQEGLKTESMWRSNNIITNCTSYFLDLDKDQAYDLYKDLRISGNLDTATPEEKQKFVDAFEQVARVVMEYDFSNFKYKDYSELSSVGFVDNRIMGHLCQELEFVSDKYEAMLSDPSVNCSLLKEQFLEYKAKQRTIEGFQQTIRNYNEIQEQFFNDTCGYDIDKLLRTKSTEELGDMASKVKKVPKKEQKPDDKEPFDEDVELQKKLAEQAEENKAAKSSKLFLLLSAVKSGLESGYLPNADPALCVEEERQKYGLTGPSKADEALDALRGHDKNEVYDQFRELEKQGDVQGIASLLEFCEIKKKSNDLDADKYEKASRRFQNSLLMNQSQFSDVKIWRPDKQQLIEQLIEIGAKDKAELAVEYGKKADAVEKQLRNGAVPGIELMFGGETLIPAMANTYINTHDPVEYKPDVLDGYLSILTSRANYEQRTRVEEIQDRYANGTAQDQMPKEEYCRLYQRGLRTEVTEEEKKELFPLKDPKKKDVPLAEAFAVPAIAPELIKNNPEGLEKLLENAKQNIEHAGKYQNGLEELKKEAKRKLALLEKATKADHENSDEYNAMHASLKALADCNPMNMSVEDSKKLIGNLNKAAKDYEKTHSGLRGLFKAGKGYGADRLNISRDLQKIADQHGELLKEHGNRISQTEQISKYINSQMDNMILIDREIQDRIQKMPEFKINAEQNIYEIDLDNIKVPEYNPENEDVKKEEGGKAFSIQAKLLESKQALVEMAEKDGIPSRENMTDCLAAIVAVHVAASKSDNSINVTTEEQFNELKDVISQKKPFQNMVSQLPAETLYNKATRDKGQDLYEAHNAALKNQKTITRSRSKTTPAVKKDMQKQNNLKKDEKRTDSFSK